MQSLGLGLGLTDIPPPSPFFAGVGTDLIFSTGQYLGVTGPISSFLTTSRASVGTASDLAGNWSSFAPNVVRQTNLGVWNEESRTNSIRNNSMQGAVVADGVELITNGTFAGTSGTGWTAAINGGTGSVNFGVTGQASITGDGTHQSNLTQSITTVIGRQYNIVVTAAGNAVFVQVGNSVGTSGLLGRTAPAGATTTFAFVASATTTFIGFAVTAAVTTVVSAISTQWGGGGPNNWSLIGGGLLAAKILAVGTTQGINTIDASLSGITSGTETDWSFESLTQISASYGQVWTLSGFFQALLADPNITGAFFEIIGLNGSQIEVNRAVSGNLLSGAFTRFQVSYMATSPTLASILVRMRVAHSSGVTVNNFQFRAGGPQAELNALLNSSVASATVQAGGSGGTNGAVVLTVVGGSGTSATLNGTIAGNALTAIGSVATAGSYTTFPPGPAAVTGGGLVGATVNLTPTNNAALGFATTPIVTSGAAALRNADAISMPMVVGSAYTLFLGGTPLSPIGAATNFLASLSDGSSNNRLIATRQSSGGVVANSSITGGVLTFLSTGTVWATNAPGKTAISTTAGAQAAVFNGGAAQTGAGGLPVGVNKVNIGTSEGGGQSWNGYISRIAIWPNTALSSAQLQAITT